MSVESQFFFDSSFKNEKIWDVFSVSHKIIRSSHQGCSVKKVFLEILQNSEENTCARASFLIVSGLRPSTLLKKRLWHKCFPVTFAKFLRTPFLNEHLWWLLLKVCTFCSFLQFSRFELSRTFRRKTTNWNFGLLEYYELKDYSINQNSF